MTLTTCPPHSFIDKIIISLYRSILKFFPHLLPQGGPHPAKADCLLLLSIPRTARSDHRKSFLCRCLKNDKTASLSLLGKRFFAFFALFGGEHPRWGDFEKSALKSPETRMNTEFFSSHAGSNLVGVKGFEPPASCSQSRRATNCATPRF